MKVLRTPVEFEWDNGNNSKNFLRHEVTDVECEEVFFDHAKRIVRDVLHSGDEERFIVIGKTKAGRILFVVFTTRKQKVRIIFARNLNKKNAIFMKKKLNIPRFRNEAKERAFWAKVDLSAYFNADDFERASFPNLKPTSRSISLRLPEYLIVRVKEHANELNVPYQSLMKQYIAQGVVKES